MIVFVETVFIENFVIDLFLLWLTKKSLNQKVLWQNLFVSASFGAVFVLLVSKLWGFGFWTVLLKIFGAFLMCVAIDFSFKQIFQKMLLFVFYTFCFGGLLIAVCWLFNLQTNFSSGTILGAGGISLGLILVMFFAFLALCVFLLKKFYQKQHLNKFCYDLKLVILGQTFNLKGFLDTGNTVFDSSKRPVLILCKKQLSKMLSPLQMKKLLTLCHETLNIKSVAGSKSVFVFNPDLCEFNGKAQNVSVGVCEDEIFKANDFDIILNPKMLEV